MSRPVSLFRRDVNSTKPYYRFVSRNEPSCLYNLSSLFKAVGSFLAAQVFNFLLLSDLPFWVGPLVAMVAGMPLPLWCAISVSLFIGFVVFLIVRLVFVVLKREKISSFVRDMNVYVSEVDSAIQAFDEGGQGKLISLEDICQQCVDFCCRIMSVQMPRSGIGCAIRMVDNSKVDDSPVGYVTIARTGRLSPGRSLKSEPVSIDGAIVGILTSKDAARSELVICPDVPRAHRYDQLESDENAKDEVLSKEILSMAISSIPIGIDGHLELAGILYITSDKVDAFGGGDIDLIVSISKLVSVLVTTRLEKRGEYTGNGAKLNNKVLSNKYRRRKGRR